MARILVADDSATVRAALRVALGGRGHVVLEACDGAEALALAFAERPECVLLDLQMPRLDGHGVLAALAAEAELASIPVIVLSSRDDVGAVVAALHAGAHDYLTKPFEPAELLARVQAAVRTAALQAELRSRNAELQSFSVTASHDLKNPLAIIKGMAETLLRAGERLPPETRDDLLARISAAATRAATMIDDLLSLARTEAGGGDAITVDPEALAHEVVAAAGLDRAEVRIEGRWAPAAIPRPELQAVLANLVGNAGHYGRGVDGHLQLLVVGAVRDAHLEIDVEDRGPGVDRAEVDRLFEPFHRAAGSLDQNPSSTGVGLAIVERAVERAGGEVSIERALPSGARFRVRLPLAPDATAAPISEG